MAAIPVASVSIRADGNDLLLRGEMYHTGAKTALGEAGGDLLAFARGERGAKEVAVGAVDQGVAALEYA